MAKFKPGIPDTFTLNVEPVQDLGDYLDEPPLNTRPVRKAAPPTEAPAPALQPAHARSVAPVPAAAAETSGLVESQAAGPVKATVPVRPVLPATVLPSVEIEIPPPALVVAPSGTVSPPKREPRPKAPRREISMTPETLRMSDELLDLIRGGSGQRDTKGSELFHALVLLVYEAKDEVDLHAIPKRGQWGTPTARAYPAELKNAFLKALVRRHADEGEQTSTVGSHPSNTD